MAKRFVSNDDLSARMFRSDVLEKFTKVHPAAPHVIFLPVIGYMLYASTKGVSLGTTALLFLAGLAIWSFTEYIMHRFVFHVPTRVQEEVHRRVEAVGPEGPTLPALEGFQQLRYFIAHGVHHDFPNDSRRLVMPPSVSIPLAFLFYFLFAAVFGSINTPALFAGLVLGYLVYDTTHYAIHHFPMRTRIGRYLKRHHFRHHYLDSTKDYGVSSPVWDAAFRTLGAGAVAHQDAGEREPAGSPTP